MIEGAPPARPVRKVVHTPGIGAADFLFCFVAAACGLFGAVAPASLAWGRPLESLYI